MIRKACLAFLLVLLLVARLPAQNDSTLDLSAYLAQLDGWSRAVKHLAGRPDEAERLRKELPRAWQVVHEGQRFEVSTRWLNSALEAIAKDPKSAPAIAKEALARLAAMRVEAEGLSNPPAFDAAAARARLAGILDRREFRSVRGPTWLDRLREQAAVLFDKLLNAVFARVGRHDTALRFLGWTLAVAAVLLFLCWLARLLLYRPVQPAHVASELSDSTSGWSGLARAAMAAASRGDFRDALRLAYWAGIFRLEELGVWPADRARTHREYLRLLPASHPQRDTLRALTSRFERVWYGGAAASRDDFHAALSELERLGCPFPSNRATAGS